MENSSIYAILDPRKPGIYTYPGCDFVFDYEPIYIGKGTGNCYSRKYRHLKDTLSITQKNNPIKINKIQAIRKENLEPIFILIKTKLARDVSYKIEIEYIKFIGRIIDKTGPLTNVSVGGEAGAQGVIVSEDRKRLLSEKMKNSYHYLRGKSMSEELKNKLRKAHLGKKPSEETKKLYSKMRTGKPLLKKRKSYSAKSPTGEIVFFTGLIEFCNKNGINCGDVSRCLRNINKSAKGWTEFTKINQ